MEFLDLAPGRCRVALTLRPAMLNHLGRPHGGVIFSLADVAFGAACNTRGGTWVALSMTISWVMAIILVVTLVNIAKGLWKIGRAE